MLKLLFLPILTSCFTYSAGSKKLCTAHYCSYCTDESGKNQLPLEECFGKLCVALYYLCWQTQEWTLFQIVSFLSISISYFYLKKKYGKTRWECEWDYFASISKELLDIVIGYKEQPSGTADYYKLLGDHRKVYSRINQHFCIGEWMIFTK